VLRIFLALTNSFNNDTELIWSVTSSDVTPVHDRYRIITKDYNRLELEKVKEEISWDSNRKKNVALAVAHKHNAVALFDNCGTPFL
jgi:hypothetical protein